MKPDKAFITLFGIIILANIFEFFHALPPSLDWIEKLATLVLIGYIFYHANLTRVFFGESHPHINLSIVITCFILIGNVLVFSLPVGGSKFLELLMRSLQMNITQLSVFLLFLGGLLFLCISVYITHSVSFKKPSFIAAMHETGKPPKQFSRYFERVVVVFLILLGFYYFIFRVFIEWFALAVHATFLIVLLLLFLIFMLFYHKHFKTKKMLQEISSAGEEYFEKFVKLFHKKRNALFAISCLLILHPLVDIANFIIPYLTGFYNEIYLIHLPVATHQALGTLMAMDAVKFPSFLTSYIYYLNVIAMILFLSFPFLVWWKIFHNKKPIFPKVFLTIFAAALPVFLFAPLFSLNAMRNIPNVSLIGVDIQTNALQPAFSLINIFIISLILGILTYYLYNKHKKAISFAGIFASAIFLAYYVIIFFIDTWIYLVDLFKNLWAYPGFVLISEIAAILVLVFLILSILFYPLSFIVYLSEIRASLKK